MAAVAIIIGVVKSYPVHRPKRFWVSLVWGRKKYSTADFYEGFIAG